MPEPVKTIAGTAAPLAADDVDTDQIIPAQFLKVTEKAGLGRYLFHRWRYDGEENLTGEFVLDRPEFLGSNILVAGRNFGIGSSRENAVWALIDFGVRCVVASSFGDIFYNNAARNGLLCVRLRDADLVTLTEAAASPGLQVTVDLSTQSLSYQGRRVVFDIERHIGDRLMNGTDDVDLTLRRFEDVIRRYEEDLPRYARPRTTNP